MIEPHRIPEPHYNCNQGPHNVMAPVVIQLEEIGSWQLTVTNIWCASCYTNRSATDGQGHSDVGSPCMTLAGLQAGVSVCNPHSSIHRSWPNKQSWCAINPDMLGCKNLIITALIKF